jgi:hypothetical protein
MPSPASGASGASVRPLLRRAPLYLLLFLTPFAALTAWTRGRIPMAEHYYLQDKARYFLEHKDEFDLVFLGSSATFRNYVPPVVDAGLAEEGLEVRSFNFGILGFRSFETDFLLRWVLDQEPKRLKWVVIEPPSFEVHSREVHIHTPLETALMMHSIWLDQMETRKKVDGLWSHLKLGVMNVLNVGRGPEILKHWREHDEDWTPPEWLTRDSGFEAVDERPTFVRPEPNPLGTIPHYHDRARSVDRANRRSVPVRDYNYAALRSEVAVIREHGVVPIYCFSPILHAWPEANTLSESGELPNFLAFNLPVSYPDLFKYQERVDGTHYYRVGAERFSRFLGPHLAEVLKATAP